MRIQARKKKIAINFSMRIKKGRQFQLPQTHHMSRPKKRVKKIALNLTLPPALIVALKQFSYESGESLSEMFERLSLHEMEAFQVKKGSSETLESTRGKSRLQRSPAA